MADIDVYTRDFRRLQDQKSKRAAGGVEARVLTNLAFYYGEHAAFHKRGALIIPEVSNNEIRLVFNFVRRWMRKLLGRLTSVQGDFRASPNHRDSVAIAKAEVASKLIKALDRKVQQPQRLWEIWWWMMIGGVAFEHVNWVPDATIEPGPKMDETGEQLFLFSDTEEEVTESLALRMIESGVPDSKFQEVETGIPQGDVNSTIYGPLNVFVDHAVRDLQKLAPDQRVMIAEAKSVEWIRAQRAFSDTDRVQPMREIDIVKSNLLQYGDSLSNTNLRDLLPIVSGEVDEESNVAVFVQSYAPPSPQYARGKYCCFVPGQVALLEMDLPYVDLEIPVVDYHWSPVTTSFWSDDYVTDIIVPNKFINKRFSQLAAYSNAFIQSPRLLGPGLSKDDIPTDYPGYVADGLSEQGEPLVKQMEPPQIPGWFSRTNDDVMRFMSELAGGIDLLQEHKFPGQLRGPLAVPMLQEILDTEWGPLFTHVGEQLARVKKLRLNRVKQFYPPKRTLHYTGPRNRDEVLEFHTDEILRTDVEYNITVDPSTLMPELKSMREARVRERVNSPLAVLYIDKRTGQIDPTKIAADLQWGEDDEREAKEAQYRKLARELITKVKRGEPITMILPWWDHHAMLDEYEAEMATTEFLDGPQELQQAFFALYEQHRQFLMQQQEAAQQTFMNQQVQGAVAQATQQVAARTAAETFDATIGTMKAATPYQPGSPEMTPELLAALAER